MYRHHKQHQTCGLPVTPLWAGYQAVEPCTKFGLLLPAIHEPSHAPTNVTKLHLEVQEELTALTATSLPKPLTLTGCKEVLRYIHMVAWLGCITACMHYL